MSYDRPGAKPQKLATCCVCGKETDKTTAWQYPMCYPCAAAWMRVAPTGDEPQFKAAKQENWDEIYRAFIEPWIAKQKAEIGRAA